MWKEFNFDDHFKWLDILAKIVKLYNYKKHTTIEMKPAEITKGNEKQLLNTTYKQIKMAEAEGKFKVEDHVRISKVRDLFDKKYMDYWSTEYSR